MQLHKRESTGEWLHRCEACWPFVSKVDNGFIPADCPYPHDRFCPECPRFAVVVGNVGTVYEGHSRSDAEQVFETYRDRSTAGLGRCAYEPVTLLENDEPIAEHTVTHVEEIDS